jgi:hypothetical protein
MSARTMGGWRGCDRPNYEVYWSANLDSNWTSTGVTQQIIADTGTHRVIRAQIPKGASMARFVRLKITDNH